MYTTHIRSKVALALGAACFSISMIPACSDDDSLSLGENMGGSSGSAGANAEAGAGAKTTGGAGGADANPCAGIPECDLLCPGGTTNPTDENGCVHTCECVADPGAGGGGGEGGLGGDPCARIPQCQLPCPEPRINPVDENGCVHTCECVDPGTTSELKLYYSCGDPVCRGHTPASELPPCTTEASGDDCTEEGPVCDPGDECNRVLVCTNSDPTAQPGGCPISRRRYKRDIHYLGATELEHYRDELLTMKLATWRYKHDPSRERLGFIIDDHETSVAVDWPTDSVDLYGYTSLAIAALQTQAQQIERLERDIAALPQRPCGD
jgi:hypothetical protein